MIRNIKILGLALVAVLAMSAMSTSTASAQQGILTSSGPVTLDGADEANSPFKLTAFGRTWECTSTYTGHRYNVTPHEPIPVPVSLITITPTFDKCSSEGLPVTVKMNGCDLVLRLEVTTIADEYEISTDVVCPGTASIDFELYSGAGHTMLLCTLKVPAQTTLKGGRTEILTVAGKLTERGTFKGLRAITKNPLCGSGETNIAQEHLAIEFNGTDSKKAATAVNLSHN